MATIDIQQLYDVPDISFIEGITVDSIINEMITDYEQKYEEITKKEITLRPTDKDTILINIYAGKFYQLYERLDFAAKMNLLKYSRGDFLKHLGAMKKTFLNEPKSAVTIARFHLEEVRPGLVYIPAGTRITAGTADGIYFATDNYAEIPVGTKSVDIACTCETQGEIGNGYIEGQLDIIVDPIPYVSAVENITKTEGGAGEETDDEFRERIFLAPSSFSTAGPADAYEYWVRQYNSAAIEDVKIYEPAEAVVDVRVLLKGGELPSTAFCEKVKEYLLENPVVPLTDNSTVSAPDVVEYNLKATYYISRRHMNNLDTIKAAIEDAKDEYILYQRSGIGRDINPDVLIEFVRAAGGKRVVIESPSFQVVQETSVAQESKVEFVFGGLEDD